MTIEEKILPHIRIENIKNLALSRGTYLMTHVWGDPAPLEQQHYIPLDIEFSGLNFVSLNNVSPSHYSRPQICLARFDSRTRCQMRVESAVGSLPCSEGFSPGSPVFLPRSSKIKISKFQFDWEFEGHGFVSLRLLCVTLVKQSRLLLSLLSLLLLLLCSKTICMHSKKEQHRAHNVTCELSES